MRRAEQGRGLRAVVFVDTVGSTQIASTLGDKRWQELLRRELLILRRLLKERGGHEVDTAGDGLFALFREPAPAVRFAASACEAVREIGLEIRAGVHFGEVEFSDGRPSGIVVHTGARVMSVGAGGEVLVTQTVRELVSGGDLSFADHGTHSLKGIPGMSALSRLKEIDDRPVASPLTEEEAAERLRESSQRPALVERRTFLVGAGAGAVAIGAAGFLLTRREETPKKTNRPARQTENRLFRYVPDTAELTPMPGIYGASGFLPSIAVGEGALWTGDLYLHHVDPEDGSERDPIELLRGDSDFVYGVTVGLDQVWVTTGSGLYRIDPGDDEVSGFRALLGGALAIAIGFGGVWVGNVNGTLYRVEPSRELPILATIHVGELVSGVTVTDDAVWVSDEFGGALIPIDPSGDRKGRPVTIGGSPKGLAATSDRVWAVDTQGTNVRVVDIETREEVRSIPVDGEPVDVAAGLGAIWVADYEGRIVKIDTALLEVVAETPVDGPVAALAIDEDEGVIFVRTGRER